MIIYFTGTGNSLSVANTIASVTGDAVVHLSKAPTDLTSESTVGFVYPVYYYETPHVIQDYLKTIKLSKDTYVFSVVTCGGSQGNTSATLKKYVEQAGGQLSYAKVLVMPDNSAIGFGGNCDDQIPDLPQNMADARRIAEDIKARKQDSSCFKGMKAAALMNAPVLFDNLLALPLKHKTDLAKCTGCGICVRLCPTANLSLVDGKVAQGSHCALCLACVHACPTQANILKFAKSTDAANQYRNPDVSLTDMFLR